MVTQEFDFDKDPEDEIAQPPTVENTFAAAGPSELVGVKGGEDHTYSLEGWSGRRRAASFEIGFTGDGSVLDPMRVIYTCCIEPKTLHAIFRNRELAREAFLVWCEENDCFDPTSANWPRFFESAQLIINDVEKAGFENKDKAPTGGRGLLGN